MSAARKLVEISNVRVRTAYRRLAATLRAGADQSDATIAEGLASGRISIEQARERAIWSDALRMAAGIVEKARPRTGVATAGKIGAGRSTRERVIAKATQLKRDYPRLSKSDAARRISKEPKENRICGYDQARKYLDASYDAFEWKNVK